MPEGVELPASGDVGDAGGVACEHERARVAPLAAVAGALDPPAMNSLKKSVFANLWVHR